MPSSEVTEKLNECATKYFIMAPTSSERCLRTLHYTTTSPENAFVGSAHLYSLPVILSIVECLPTF